MYRPSVPPEPAPNEKKLWWLIPVGIAVGLLLIWIAADEAQELTNRWSELSWLQRAFSAISMLFFGPLGIALFLAPFRKVSMLAAVLRVLLWVPEGILIVGHYYSLLAAPLITFAFVAGVPALLQKYLQKTGFLVVADKAILYMALVFASLVFTYWGAKLTVLVFLDDKKKRSAGLERALRPTLVRVYIYGLIAVAYSLANIEKFGGATLVPLSAWTAYRDVLVEVLLTYAAFDAVIGLAKQWKSGSL